MSFKHKWDEDLNNHTEQFEWENIFRKCFYTIHDNYLIWFQYKIIHRILGTCKSLYNMGIILSQHVPFVWSYQNP